MNTFPRVILAMVIFSLSMAFDMRAQVRDEPVNPAILEQMAERGNPDAQFELGIRLLGGEGLEKDEKKAAEWLQKGAAQQHLPSMNALGTLYETGAGLAKDEKKAYEWYLRAAEYGYPLAQQNVSECFERGRGVAQDSKEASKWLARAAHQDFAPAQALYGWKLETGTGIEKDTKEAANWYLKSAQGGLVRAMTRLAYMYYIGKGVPLDYRRAEAWYRRAARSDDPMARNDLAWFLSVCPDDNFHDGDSAVDFARSSLADLKEEDYQVIDTLAAALARSGNYGEAVQTQTKAILAFEKEKTSNKEMSPEDVAKLEQELSERLKTYRGQQPFTEEEPKFEAGTKPLMDDRILEEEHMPRRKKRNVSPGNDIEIS
ncbi:tetratricopeptide repeat protein [Phragmitibacter flavus]|nr:tetratricopeptide repeat protein [Phragmitibacter flavus]